MSEKSERIQSYNILGGCIKYTILDQCDKYYDLGKGRMSRLLREAQHSELGKGQQSFPGKDAI